MATLPQGWTADYDGQRWFFCYAATSHIQYHFPKPGDEFPDFSLVGELSQNDGLLLPEEKLESERQVRKKLALETGRKKRSAQRTEQEDGEIDGQENGLDEGSCWFESFGYLGPGSYEDARSFGPIVEDRQGSEAHGPSSLGAVSSLTSVGNGNSMSIGVTPQADEPSSKDCTTMGDGTSDLAELPSVSARCSHSQRPTSQIPMLCGRKTASSPAGFIAELVSELTALCEEEINPPPVELPDTGASWLDLGPVPNLVNQYPVELPSGQGMVSEHTLPPNDCQGEHRLGEETDSPDGKMMKNENESGWSTNWMSTSIQPQPPARTPMVSSRSDLPSRQGEGPQIPPKVPHDEKMYQRRMDFLPAAVQQPKPLQRDSDTQIASYTRHDSETRQNSLDRFPSILRPGPRRSTQPPDPTVRLNHQPSSKSPLLMSDAGPRPQANGAQFKAYHPPCPHDILNTGRPHSQSAEEGQASAHLLGEVLIMPNPDDHVRALHLARSSNTSPT
ncbi:hypothetical protein N0V93_006148 [Gnomoniopsis smithogilvyi]|uniref:WW domain-containing protein n=1 Tax=Gnomoniopsis smithogilvyi TaxID=1191159 RepID=A0A9W8YPA6_9PEZI|nr:hypothetical protein N0V93_006148 [Gnomoniopsis smithogilvyi]